MSATCAFQPTLPGFESVNRYRDAHTRCIVAKILPGEYYVTMNREQIATVLGSCVAACIRDKVFGIGGMNHFMLPQHCARSDRSVNSGVLSDATRYGTFAMEHLINDILKCGGHRKNLEVKIFGGGRMIEGLSDIGFSNVNFVKKYLATENLTIAVEDTGGTHPRKIIYDPRSGRVRLKRLKQLHNSTILDREASYRKQLQDQPVDGGIELFTD